LSKPSQNWERGEVCFKLIEHVCIANLFVLGIYGPGYDERRRERIKEKYGIDVPAKP
jgi:hypothetical protein